MRRRAFLAATTVSFLAGCAGGEGTESSTSSDTKTEGLPASGTATPEGTVQRQTATPAGTKTVQTPDTEDQTATESEGFSEETVQSARETGVDIRGSVVKVSFERGYGTGWFIDDRTVVTNAHVVQRADSPTVELYDGTTVAGTVIGYVESLAPDVGALTVPPETGPSGLPTGDHTSLSEGQPLVQVGHPGIVGDWTISLGRYQGYRRSVDWLFSTVPTASGNSGGPLTTLDGTVVGVTSGSTRVGTNHTSHGDPAVYTGFEVNRRTTSTPVSTLESHLQDWR